MSLFLTDFDQWYAEYEAESPQQQYELFKAAITQPIPIEYAEEIDLGMMLIEVWEKLVDHNQVNQILALIALLRQQQPVLYQQEYHYFADFLVRYHLFYNQPDAVREVLAQLKTNCIQGIDQLIAVSNDLQFYGATEPLIELCQSVYQPVATSSELIGGTEIEFGTIVITHLFEQAYQQLQQGITVDWEALSAEAAAYGFVDNAEMRAEVEHNLTVEIEGSSEFFQRFNHDCGSALRQLMLGFCREMSTQQMSFVTSQGIWEAILDFLEDRALPKKQLAHPDSYFAITQQSLDQYVARKIGGLLSLQQAKGVAILWGIPYLYEFLYSKQIIAEQIAQRAIAATQELKTQLIQGFSTYLWQYDFVHRWPRPNSVSEAEFTAEAEQFAISIEQSEPLSDQPMEYSSWESRMEQLAAQMRGDASMQNPANRSQSTEGPLWQSPRPRKSPLQEARELPDSKPRSKSPSSGKKKGGKGFG